MGVTVGSVPEREKLPNGQDSESTHGDCVRKLAVNLDMDASCLKSAIDKVSATASPIRVLMKSCAILPMFANVFEYHCSSIKFRRCSFISSESSVPHLSGTKHTD